MASVWEVKETEFIYEHNSFYDNLQEYCEKLLKRPEQTQIQGSTHPKVPDFFA